MNRLGPRTLLQACPKALNYNWFLDCSIPEHNEVTQMLIREAQGDDTQNWYNLKLTGAQPRCCSAACALLSWHMLRLRAVAVGFGTVP